MSVAFLHGIETIEATPARSVRAVRTAVIGLVGTAPTFALAAGDVTRNTPVLIQSAQAAARYFGPDVSGYSIPAALAAILKQGAATVVVVNVFDATTHKTVVAASAKVLDANDKIITGHVGLTAVVVKNAGATVTYVLDTDYTLDAVNGIITRKAGGAIASGATLTVNYTRADVSLVAASDIIGGTDGAGVRSGLEALRDAPTQLGITPKILIAPGYSSGASVVTALETLTPKLRAVALADAPVGTTVAQAIAGRSLSGSIAFTSASDRVALCYPYLKCPDPASTTGGTRLEPMSQYMAGVLAATDDATGFWVSPSNRRVIGPVGLERAITASISDPTSEANTLNAAGIITAFAAYGTGLRIWGNRSAAYPTRSDALVFLAARRTADQIADALDVSMLDFLDSPVTRGLVAAIAESGSAYLRTLSSRGALIGDASCVFDAADNPVDEVASGILRFRLSYMPAVPAERLAFTHQIDRTQLTALAAQTTA